MEWYDFAVYGYFAGTIGQLFFPANKPVVSLIASFGAFAAGFLVRPLGGLVFGRIGDLVGRQRAMLLSVMAMAIPTVVMGLLPTYGMIGVAAPVLLVMLRLIQGLSVGGNTPAHWCFWWSTRRLAGELSVRFGALGGLPLALCWALVLGFSRPCC
jgi:MHS family proline/betaine transporter-like MFS transporter